MCIASRGKCRKYHSEMNQICRIYIFFIFFFKLVCRIRAYSILYTAYNTHNETSFWSETMNYFTLHAGRIFVSSIVIMFKAHMSRLLIYLYKCVHRTDLRIFSLFKITTRFQPIIVTTISRIRNQIIIIFKFRQMN